MMGLERWLSSKEALTAPREPGFESHHPSMAHSYLELQFQGIHLLFWPLWALHTSGAQMYIQAKHPYI